MVDAKIVRGELLARHTTLRIGGPAEYFVRADSRDELIQAVEWARTRRLEIFILGNGSNILVSDAGVHGLVVENHADAVEQHVKHEASNVKREASNVKREASNVKREAANVKLPVPNSVRDETLVVIADSGASLPGLANRLARQGWRGLEWAIGIPGTVGAAVVTNAGAHGGAVNDCLARAEILDLDNDIRWWARDELQYDYRTSFLKEHPNQFVVLRAEFELQRDDPAACVARMNQYTEHRRRTQPTDPSVGSMFKNPPGDYAGRLIEAAGLKGKRVGNVQVSEVHANFFVNVGGGTAREILALVELVREKVREKFGVELELEIQVVGE